MVEAGGDTQFAVRALQPAMGSKGLGLWTGNPQRMWVEAFPDGQLRIDQVEQRGDTICEVNLVATGTCSRRRLLSPASSPVD